MAYSRRITYLIGFSFFVFGIIEGVLTVHTNALSFIHGFILMVGAVLWCSYHAEENEVKLPQDAIIFCILIPFLGVPYYLLRGFGFKSGGLKLLWFFLFVLICVIIYFIPAELIKFLSR